MVTHGSDELRKRALRPMFTGEDVWCQLFSEPGSGSDLAGLSTRCVRDGDEWVVNGQKVWNTLAHLANKGMLVARTDPELPKHKGLTYFMVDMHAPGVEVRPLRQITGEAEFNEVYLTDARIPDADRIGDIGDGWRVSMTTLMNERTTIGAGTGGPKRGGGSIAEAIYTWNHTTDHSPARRDQLMKLWCDAEVLRLTNMRAAQKARAGNPGPEGSIAKLAFADAQQVGVRVVHRHARRRRASSTTTTRSAARAKRCSTARPARRASCSCARARTRSRAARRRSCATSSASASSASPASRASTATCRGRRCREAERARSSSCSAGRPRPGSRRSPTRSAASCRAPVIAWDWLVAGLTPFAEVQRVFDTMRRDTLPRRRLLADGADWSRSSSATGSR